MQHQAQLQSQHPRASTSHPHNQPGPRTVSELEHAGGYDLRLLGHHDTTAADYEDVGDLSLVNGGSAVHTVGDTSGNNLTATVDPAGPLDEEPLYVNAKQYHRILKRRIARSRLEEIHRLSRQRKVCWKFAHLIYEAQMTTGYEF